MSFTPFTFFLFVLAVWRLSSLAANENGPFYVFEHLRRAVLRKERTNRLVSAFHLYEGLTCEWCNSVWFGTFLLGAWAWFGDIVLVALLPLAVSTGVIFLKFVIQTLEQLLERVAQLNRKEN